MKAASAIAVLAMVTVLAGCEPQAPAARFRAGARDGLAVALTLSHATPKIGDKVIAVVEAANTSKNPIVVSPETTAPAYVEIWRPAGESWARFKRVPQAETTRLSPWRLEPGQVKTFRIVLAVTPDWPTVETMRVTAELNGRPDVKADALLRVQPRPQPAP